MIGGNKMERNMYWEEGFSACCDRLFIVGMILLLIWGIIKTYF